ncbi:MAG: hypothetical protein DMF62_11695 [Acidobacteria bacterium]|nr:MAG: hypothetical protein DMF62_11695 [Acidobacteriota bacterium]
MRLTDGGELNQTPRQYEPKHDPVVARFPWVVVDQDDQPAPLWANNPKVGPVPMRFRTRAAAQGAADALNKRDT